MTAPARTNAARMRERRLLRPRIFFREPIAHRVHGVQERLRERVIDRPAQHMDMGAQRVGLRRLFAPELGLEPGSRHDGGRFAHQDAQKLVVQLCEPDWLSGSRYRHGALVQHEIPDLQPRLWEPALRTTQQRAQARLELAQRNRLYEVVVAAKLQAADPVLEL